VRTVGALAPEIFNEDPVAHLVLDPDVAEDGAGELGKKPSTRFEPGAVLRREGDSRRPAGWLASQALVSMEMWAEWLSRINLIAGWAGIGGIEKLEEFDELAAAMAILDQSVNLTGVQIDAGEQADRAITLIFMIRAKVDWARAANPVPS
jgi:hypothetical protein